MGLMGTMYQNIFKDVWNYMDKNFVPKSDKQWDEAIAECTKIASKYDNNPFIVEIMTAIMNEFERRSNG